MAAPSCAASNVSASTSAMICPSWKMSGPSDWIDVAEPACWNLSCFTSLVFSWVRISTTPGMARAVSTLSRVRRPLAMLLVTRTA